MRLERRSFQEVNEDGSTTSKVDFFTGGVFLCVFAVPLGKLVYLPGTDGFGVTAAALLLPIFAALYISTRRISWQSVLIPLTVLTLALLSLVSLQDISKLGIYNYVEIAGYHSGETGTKDSVLGRLVFILAYGAIYIAIIAMGVRDSSAVVRLWRWFSRGVIVASIVGVGIFAGVALGSLDSDSISAISAHSHIVVTGVLDFYRFNPGANVNQFGKYAAIGLAFTLLMQRQVKFRGFVVCLLGFALVASLTRSAWVGFLLGLLSVAVHQRGSLRKLRTLLYIGFTLLGTLGLLLVFAPGDVLEMIGQRLEFSPGAGGNERLIKVEDVFQTLYSADSVTQLFGNGWATNLYVHSVPFQILYEMGVVGFLLGTLMMLSLWWRLHCKYAFSDPYLNFLRVALAVTTIDMLLQHSMYHPSTWLVLASAAAYSSRQLAEIESHKYS